MVMPFFAICVCLLKSYFQETRGESCRNGRWPKTFIGQQCESTSPWSADTWEAGWHSWEAGRWPSWEEDASRRSRCTHRQVRGQQTRGLWFTRQQLFFLFSDLCPGDSNLENEGVAAQDAATYAYLIEMISFDDGDGKAGGRAKWQLLCLVGSSPGLWAPRVPVPLCYFLPIQHKTFSLISWSRKIELASFCSNHEAQSPA